MATADTAFYNFAHLYGSEELSDLTIVLSTATESAPAKPQPAKRARTAKQCAPEAAQIDGEEVLLPGHGVIVGGCSPVFMAQLTRWREQAGSSGANDKPRITLRVSNAEEMQAARSLVQFMYQRQLPDDASQPLLLTMLRLADKFDVRPCAVACGSALSKLELDPDALMQVLQLPPSYHGSPLFSSLYSKAADQLQQEFGDLEVAWADAQKAERFLALPHIGVKLLLGDKRTRVAYENTVLAAATAWVEAHEDHTTADEKQQLAQLIRCPFFTPFFATTVATAIAWFVDALGATTIMAAAGICAAIGGARRPKLAAFKHGKADYGWPECWALGERPKSACLELSFNWHVPLASLQSAFADASFSATSPFHRYGGYAWRVFTAREGSACAGTLGLNLTPAISGNPDLTESSAPLVMITAGSITCTARDQVNPCGFHMDDQEPPYTVIDGTSRGVNDFWGTGPMSEWTAAKFAPFIADSGHLTVKVKISKIK